MLGNTLIGTGIMQFEGKIVFQTHVRTIKIARAENAQYLPTMRGNMENVRVEFYSPAVH